MTPTRWHVAGALVIAALVWIPALRFVFTPAAASSTSATGATGVPERLLLLAAGLLRLKK